MLVGDLLLGLREQATDLPQVLAPPNTPVFTDGGTGGTLANTAPWYLKATYLTPWGESLPSNEGQIVSTGKITVTIPAEPTTWGTPKGATAIRVYYSLTSGGEDQYTEFPISTAALTQNVVTISDGGIPATPPQRSMAYLPDTDGAALSVLALYRWLNEGMNAAASINGGGLPDSTGVQTTVGQPVYNMTGYWKKIDNAWYDGYAIGLGRKQDVFRRNKVTGRVGTLTVQQVTDKLIVELWPQPNRTGGQSTLSATLSDTSVSASLSGSNFTLGFGLALIGTEMVSYASNSGGQLTGLIRGMGGTRAASWPIATPVRELNLMVSGYRVPTPFKIGDAAQPTGLPPGWEEALEVYLLSRFKKSEQDLQGSQQLFQQFGSMLQQLRANKIIAGPRQMPLPGTSGVEVAGGLGSRAGFGGVILP